MKRILTLGLAAVAVFWAMPAAAADPPVTPFPAAHSGDVFVAAQTVIPDGTIHNYFAPGSAVVFRAYAVSGKTHKLLTKKTVKYFYVKIANQPKVTLKFTPKAPGASGRYAWTGTWTVPSDYPTGIVNFKVLVKTKSRLTGSFVQMPVQTSQLTISTKPQPVLGNGPGSSPAPGSSKLNVALYVDTVNGTRPKGAPPRPIGCTQTNVYKRGEQLVVRAWGYDLATGAILTMDNVDEAHFSVPGQANVPLNWGSHGATGYKVWFWANAWIVPATYPLGDVTIQVRFTTAGGKVGSFGYPITVIP
jgi:hypothetical protein